MPSAIATVNGWRTRALQRWYPTAGGWTACTSIPEVNVVMSCPTLNSGGPSNNMFTTIIKVTTPNISGATSFSRIDITISAVDANSTTGTLYAALRTVDDSTSTTSDTTASYKTNLAGGSSIQSLSPTSGSYKLYTISFTGSFAKNTSYYLWLYTETTDDVYHMQAGNYYTCNCEYELATYTISYNANGRGIAPSEQTKTHDENITLRDFISDFITNGYKVTYDANGGSSTPSVQTNNIIYKQLYWNPSKWGTGINYRSGETYSNNSDVTLYAIWDNGTSNSINLAKNITKDNDTENYIVTYLNSNIPNQTVTETIKYTFDCWNTESDGTGTNYDAASSYTPSEDITLYAKWNSSSSTSSISIAEGPSKQDTIQQGYTVTLDANGGSVDITELVTTNTLSYTFKEWNTDSNGNGFSYRAGESYNNKENLSLYPIFTEQLSNVSPVILPIPKKSGYQFVGWSITKDGTDYVDNNYVPTNSITLYANYRQGYDVQMYLYNGGRWMNVLMS